jgi:hypothetical protein
LAAVQQSTVVALVANLKTLKSLCLAVSEALLARADQAIE